ncbi:MAG: flavin reductase family protein [Candidatus Ranarchaeia archaeon]|jgi:flavin reductase (DIM6/NTAB) family NADH-FMN oxidoreductase RutF
MVLYDPNKLNEDELYFLLTSVINPRPIALVSTTNTQGKHNLAPYSYFSGVCDKPPMLMLGFQRVEGKKKTTLQNIEAVGDFAINVVTNELMDAVCICGESCAPAESKIKKAGLTVAPGHTITAPIIVESPIHLECKLDRVIDLEGAYDLVLGKVTSIHIEDSLMLPNGRINRDGIKFVGRMFNDSFLIVKNKDLIKE